MPKKALLCFQKVDVPVVGLVENMSYFRCGQCGHQEAIFGTQGGDDLARKYQVPVIGHWPLATALRESLDEGKTATSEHP